jgi:hypothetical protein
MNVVVLRGTLSRAPEERELDSGTRLVRYEVTARGDDGVADTAPVAWLGAPARAAGEVDAGDEVVVVGRVRRRWFRRGPVTESRVEVSAEAVIPVRRAKAVRAAVDRAVAALTGVPEPGS